MTIAIFRFPVRPDISTSSVTTHNDLGLSKLSLISVKASCGRDCANSSSLIIAWISSLLLIITLRFLANPPKYFNCRFSTSNKKDVLLPVPASTITIPGWYFLAKVLSINLIANSVFFSNRGSCFPWGKELACWYNSISNGKLFLPSYKCVVTTTIPLSVLPISPIYCLPTPSVKLPLFLCPESSIIKLKPRHDSRLTTLIHDF